MLKTITVISDTHCYNWKDIHPEIKSKIRETDYAIHCGDYVHKNILDEFILNSNNPIVVHGNSDPIEIRNQIPYTQILKINSLNIGIIHPAWGKEEFDYKELERKNPRGRIGTPEDIAGLAIFLSSRAGAYTIGEVITCDGGLVAAAGHDLS